MKKYTGLFLLWIIVALPLTACVTQTPTAPQPTPSRPASPLTIPVSPLSPPPTPAMPVAQSIDTLNDLRTVVAQELGLKPADLTVVSSEEVQWPDSSLGCPQEGMSYLQVITPGWRIIFADAAGKQYDVRAPEKLSYYVLCTDAAQTPVVDKADFNSAKDAAVNALMEKLNVSRAAVSIVSVEAVSWRNSCLGCAAPDERCLLVVTPGYRILLKSNGQTYTVHTNGTGNQAIVCDNPDAEGALKP